MNARPFFPTLKRLIKRASSLLMLFQRTPAAQLLVPAEFNLAGSAALMEASKLAIVTVAGLGAYDSVAGATSLTQIAGDLNVWAGQPMSATFQVTGSPSTPKSWRIVNSPDTIPSGLSLPNIQNSVNAISGTTNVLGTRSVIVEAWEKLNFGGGRVQRSITIVVAAPAASIATNPASTTINSGQTATLSVLAAGKPGFTYTWFRGLMGDTSNPVVGATNASFTSPPLTTTTSYWVRVTNTENPTGAFSTTATVTVRQPAAIVTQPVSIAIPAGTTTTLTVGASGTGPLAYQWFQGLSGDTSTPLPGTNSDSFTTPVLTTTTNYWVKVTNDANLAGAASNTANVTVLLPDPTMVTSATLPTGRVSTAYTTTLTAVGGKEPYTWEVTGGSLPSGLVLGTDGVLSGTLGATVGSSSFTVQVRDQDAKTDSRVFSLRVSDLAVTTASLPNAVKSTAYTSTLVASGGTAPYTWTLHGGTLPSGMSLSTMGVLSGTPASSGDVAIQVRVTDSTGFSITRALVLPVSGTFIRPVLDPITFPVITVGTPFSYAVTAQNYPRTFTITGLPRGLRVGANGAITGLPEVSGVFNVQVRAANSAGSSALVTTRLTVKALPRNFVGSFGGIISRHSTSNRGLGGQFSLTVTQSGVYTLRIIGAMPTTTPTLGASASTSITGRLAASAPHITATLAGAEVRLTLDSASGDFSGSVGLATVSGWRAVWNTSANPAEHFAGYYSMALELSDPLDDGVVSIPQGSGYATFTVTQGGTLTVVGKTADGESITTSSFLSDSGDFWLFSPLYKNAGILHGLLAVTADPQGEFAGNAISGLLAWLRPTTVSRTYAAGFGPLTLAAIGSYLAPAPTGNVILGLPDAGTVSLRFTDAGLANSTANPDLNVTYTDDNKVVLPSVAANPSKVALTLNANTGAVAGNFTLVESGTQFTRSKVPFQGQVVRLPGGEIKAVGYFLLPQIPSGAQKPNDTDILSGGVQLQQSTL